MPINIILLSISVAKWSFLCYIYLDVQSHSGIPPLFLYILKWEAGKGVKAKCTHMHRFPKMNFLVNVSWFVKNELSKWDYISYRVNIFIP